MEDPVGIPWGSMGSHEGSHGGAHGVPFTPMGTLHTTWYPHGVPMGTTVTNENKSESHGVPMAFTWDPMGPLGLIDETP